MKKCPHCLILKSLDDFYKNSRGHESWCKKCKYQNVKNYKKKNQIKSCPIKAKEWYEKNKHTEAFKEKRNIYKKKWSTDPKNRFYYKAYNLKKFGITLEKYNEMLKDQDGLCGICHQTTNKFHVDHNHKTKEVRALLCIQCNLALGLIKENPAIALSLYNYIVITSNEDLGVAI